MLLQFSHFSPFFSNVENTKTLNLLKPIHPDNFPGIIPFVVMTFLNCSVYFTMKQMRQTLSKKKMEPVSTSCAGNGTVITTTTTVDKVEEVDINEAYEMERSPRNSITVQSNQSNVDEITGKVSKNTLSVPSAFSRIKGFRNSYKESGNFFPQFSF